MKNTIAITVRVSVADLNKLRARFSDREVEAQRAQAAKASRFFPAGRLTDGHYLLLAAGLPLRKQGGSRGPRRGKTQRRKTK